MNFEFNDSLFKLEKVASKDNDIRRKILETKNAKDPMAKLCEVATELGYPVTVGEIYATGEEYLSNLSDGRLGVTEPMSTFGDTYELFMASVEGSK